MLNYAFIDGQNLKKGFGRLDWEPPWDRFRIYLREKYEVTDAFYFIGYMRENEALYKDLRKCGFRLVYKEVVYIDNQPKGNVDANLVLHSMIEYPNYDRAVIVASDGDYACLARYLKEKEKLERVLSPHRYQCSAPLMKAAGEKMDFLEDVRHKIGG